MALEQMPTGQLHDEFSRMRSTFNVGRTILNATFQ